MARRRLGLAYPVAYGGVWSYPVGRDANGQAEGAAATARDLADRSGLPDAEPVGELGDPADAILRAAEEHRVDVIVVGNGARGWFDRLLRPSVSDAVVKHTEVPVLVVR